MTDLDRVIGFLGHRLRHGPRYMKTRDVAEALGISRTTAGLHIGKLAKYGCPGVRVSKWSNVRRGSPTGGTTWFLEAES